MVCAVSDSLSVLCTNFVHTSLSMLYYRPRSQSPVSYQVQELVMCIRCRSLANFAFLDLTIYFACTRAPQAHSKASCRTPLHKALYWGHIQIAALLLEQSASTYVQDAKVRNWIFFTANFPTAALADLMTESHVL